MRVGLVATAVCLSAIGVSVASDAEAAIRKSTHIAAQGLGPALQMLAKERDFQIVYLSDAIDTLRTNGAVGELTADEALTQLLEGTGFSYRYLGERAVTIVPLAAGSREVAPGVEPVGTQSHSSSVGAETPAGGAGKKSFWQRLRLAQAETRSQREGQETSERSSENPQKRIALEEIVVTGTHIRGVYPSSSPVEIYTAGDIARTGATTTEQFIQKLPQNLGTRTQNAPTATLATNREAVAGVDLRGLGVGTTLTLLNGRRLALASNGQVADISLIPVSAIERIEVLTDGASAIYGSDAIGGVINFVLRKDLDGAETRLSYGTVSSGGFEQFSATQTFGKNWASGNALASYNFFDAAPLDTLDRSFSRPAGRGTLTPDDRRHNALITAKQELGDSIRLSGDFAFARREVRHESSSLTSTNVLSHTFTTSEGDTDQYFANAGIDLRITDSLNGSLLATYSSIDVDSDSVAVFFNRVPQTSQTFVNDTDHSGLDLTATLDGTFMELPGGEARFSLGGGRLDERYTAARALSGQASDREIGRATTYAFAEVLAPLLDERRKIPMVHRLELSLAARYTKYDDSSDPSLAAEFGDKVSPRIGLLWAPVASLNLRGTYGESFRAPSLAQLDPVTSRNQLTTGLRIAGVPSTTLFVGGPVLDLEPETAQSFTAGFDYIPPAEEGFSLGATYFNIDYQDRIATADVNAGLANPANAPEAVFQPATAAQIEDFLRTTTNTLNLTSISLADPNAASLALFALPDFWILDQRLRNLALSKIDGLDLSLRKRFDTSRGQLSFGAQATKIFDYRQQTTPTSPVLTVVDVALRPVDLRGRAYVSLREGNFDGTLTVNYVDGYTNPLAVGGAPRDVDSWTTVDLSAAYELAGNKWPFLTNVRMTVSVQNILDRDPPFLARGSSADALASSVGFDPANANPLGRYISFTIASRW